MKQTTDNKKKVAFSGIQPSGELHIGNYLGAIKNWVKMLDEYECIFCVVDYHAITVPYEVGELSRRTWDAVVVNIAAGLDPERCTLFVQSHVPEHTELAWVLGTCTSMGELERMTQFKEKAKQHREFIGVGLFTYPVLQAADILLYKAEAVPVGEDQIQHIELCREIARRFNARFGETFPEPQHLLGAAPRVLGLDGKAKMSKSLGNFISLVESPEQIREKLRTAATDPARKRRSDAGNPEVCNIYTIHKGFSSEEDLKWAAEGCRSAGIGCVDCKRRLADNMISELSPVRERYLRLREDRDYISDVIRTGAERCRRTAAETMREVHAKLGIRESTGGEK